MGAGWLATMLDQEMIEYGGGRIEHRLVADAKLPPRSGADVARELGDRYLLRYMLRSQVGEFVGGSRAKHNVTPTPLAPDELASFLALPRPGELRTHVIALRPAAIPEIRGPRWVRLGKGIEYVLPHGFPKDALVVEWEIEVT